MLGLQHLTERARIRLASRGGAVALAAVVSVLMIQHPPAAKGATSASFAPAISLVTMVTPEAPRAEPLDRDVQPARDNAVAFAQATATDGDNGEGMRLWLDGPAGRVVFTDGEHYMRCLDAALEHRNVVGCPNEAAQFAQNTGRWADGPRLTIERQRVGHPTH